MAKGFIKAVLITVVVIFVLIVLIAVPLLLQTKSEGEEMVAAYQRATDEVFARANMQLQPHAIKPEFQIVNPAKALKLIKMVPRQAQTEKIGTITSMNATMFVFMKMYTLLLAPADGYNFPMLSADVVSVGKKRVFVLEIIDPAHVPSENVARAYEKMKALKEKVKGLPDTPPDMPWAKQMTMEFSIHTKGDKTEDDFFLGLYKEYLITYTEMVKASSPLTDTNQSKKVQEGIKLYVNTLLQKGGPAVNVFKFLLGPKKQEAFVKEVMFGVKE